MAGDSRKTGTEPDNPERVGPSEAELAARLRALDQRLDSKANEKRVESAARGKPGSSGLAIALSVSGAFISAILVGAAMGWGIDRFFGVTPWGMIVFTLLGFAAGIVNVLRMTGHMSGPGGGSKSGG
ncbi:MAG: AtpZ/AtpI family protein [Salaquimonas sp.]|nr:AtpZ/AtpI family protein [Salaquimonas sp.]